MELLFALLFWVLLGTPGFVIGLLDAWVIHSLCMGMFGPGVILAGIVCLMLHLLHAGLFTHNWGPAEAGIGPGFLLLSNTAMGLLGLIGGSVFFWLF